MHTSNLGSSVVHAGSMASPKAHLHPHSRPSGSAATDEDTRTLRHVQWARDSHARVEGSPDTSPRQSIHELDEMGLDVGSRIPFFYAAENDVQPNAFETLRTALEKHQSTEGLASELPSIPPRAVISPNTAASDPESHRNPFTSPPIALSAPSHTHMDSDNPYPATSAPQIQVLQPRDTSRSSTQQSSPITADISMDPSASTLVAHRTRDVPGEAWIDPLEREGLPVHAPIPNAGDREVGNILRRRSTWRRGTREIDATFGDKHIAQLAEHQAAGVVRAHTRRGWGWFQRPPNGKNDAGQKGTHEGEKGKASKGGRHRHHHTRSEEVDTDLTDGDFHRPGRVRKGVPSSWLTPVHGQQRRPEDYNRGNHHSLKLGNGVLSTLLALYGHEHEHDDEESTSGSTSGGRSRSSSDAGSEEGILPKPHRPWLADQDDNHDHSASKTHKDEPPGKFHLGRSQKAGSASSILAHIRSPSIPAASTTAALIAGAGTLSGAAAPQQSTLAPNLKRPGYHLVRYSMEEVPQTGRKTHNIFFRGFRRSHSRDSGVATDHRTSEEKESEVESPVTPGGTIVASPTGGSEGLMRGPKGHVEPVSTPGRKGWTGKLKDLPLAMHLSPSHLRGLSGAHLLSPNEKDRHTPGGSGTATPNSTSLGGTPVDEFAEKMEHFDYKHMQREAQRIKERERKARKEKGKQREKEKRRKRRKAEVYVCHHLPFNLFYQLAEGILDYEARG